jgi:RNA polymerase sigma-70 factor (ECF subfamily)
MDWRSRKRAMDPYLVARVQRGDEQAFESLTRADYQRLYRLARGVLADPHLAEDATQQAFVEIWRSIPRLRDPAKYEGWSYRLLVRACYAEAKRRPDGEVVLDELPQEPPGQDAYGSVVARDQLERGLRRLSVDHRVVLVLRFLVGMTPERVAETLGISRWTVYARSDRAMKAMRAALEADARSVAIPAPVRQESLR